MRLQTAIATAAILTFAAGAAHADEQKYVARLTGAAEATPVTSSGAGLVSAELDTDTAELSYTVTFSGLSSPVTAADFHGPAGRAAEGPVAITCGSTASPISGTVKLTQAQVHDLNAGNWYFNVQTGANPNGELRGQLKRDY